MCISIYCSSPGFLSTFFTPNYLPTSLNASLHPADLLAFLNMKHAALLATALSLQRALAKLNVPPNFQIGVKWQIVIQNTINIEAAIQPTDAVVWDLDLYHVARTPGIVDYLHVCLCVDRLSIEMLSCALVQKP